jgi:glycerol-3-phosphate dehydrogenase
VPVPGERGRWVFALPRTDGLVAIGLTDVPAPGAPADEPRPDPAEEAELLEHASAALAAPLGAEDVAGRYAGLRPLLAYDDRPTADLSRRHAVVRDPSGALVVVGGKLTTYRRMAQDVVDRLTDRPCRTRALPVVGATWGPVEAPERLVRRYGAEAPSVAALGDLEPIAPGVPACRAELAFAVRHELALEPADLADRRTRAGLVPEWREAVLEAAAEELGALSG